MTGDDYAALIAETHAKLSADSQNDHGRNGRHEFRACEPCGVHVCITHHDCPRG